MEKKLYHVLGDVDYVLGKKVNVLNVGMEHMKKMVIV